MKTIPGSSLFVLAIFAIVTMASGVLAEPYKGEAPPGSLVFAYAKSVPNSRWVVTEYLGKVKDAGLENTWLYYMQVRAARGRTLGVDGFKVIRLDTGLWIVSKTMSKAVLQASY